MDSKKCRKVLEKDPRAQTDEKEKIATVKGVKIKAVKGRK